MIKDCLDRVIEIGDVIAAPEVSAAIRHLKIGEVIGVAPKYVLVRWRKHAHYMSTDYEGRVTLSYVALITHKRRHE